MVSKKQLLIEQVINRSPNSDHKTLSRMTIHSLNTLLSTLNGVATEPMKDVKGIDNKKIDRKKRSKIRKVNDDDEVNMFIEKVDEPEEEEEEHDEAEEEEHEPESEPVPVSAPKKIIKKKKRGRPVTNNNIELDITPQKQVKSKKMSNDKAHVKEILDDFKKEVSKLISQYRKIRSKTEDHKTKLIDIYNELYDKTVKLSEDQINKSYFPDETIYDYVDKNLVAQKERIKKILQ